MITLLTQASLWSLTHQREPTGFTQQAFMYSLEMRLEDWYSCCHLFLNDPRKISSGLHSTTYHTYFLLLGEENKWDANIM